MKRAFVLILVHCYPIFSYEAYDTRDEWGACVAFAPENQGSCNACAASSMASSLGIRACIRDGRNVRFSSQRIWDCFSGSCENGVNIDSFMFAVMYSDKSENMIMSTLEDIKNSTSPSNHSACTKTKQDERIETISYHKEWWLGLINNNYNDNESQERTPSNYSTSVYNMQREIFENGPIVSILYMTTTEMNFFSRWKNKSEIMTPPLPNPTEQRTHLHAITIIGWGGQGDFKTFYWIILNSFGDKWGEMGIGKIPGGFGLVEHEWYSLSSSSIPCTSSCLNATSSSSSSSSRPRSREKNEDVMIMLPLQKQNGLEDGGILGITMICMGFLSLIICTFHANKLSGKRSYNHVLISPYYY